MESKNLNDIVIEDNDNSKKAQLKNILTLLALLFIILVISIVITKLILGGDDENSETSGVEGNKTELTQSDSSSGIDGTTVATAAAVGATAALATSALKNDESKKDESKPLLTERNTTSRKKPSLRDEEIKGSSKKVETKKSTESKKSSTTKRAYVPKKRNTTPTKKRPAASATRGYYIKVGAFKDPSNAIKEIKAVHLRYKKIQTKSGMATRVLVGPYYSQKDAQNDLTKVKKIAADAYITKIK
ncbi:SPOR domain-containing protein [Sulfurovum sp. bin170]|uniref:SPOR domain-containing protein n=1 Tax=Sulfurovum sp. bin170 TaxID=2695268 RepID=UPI0013DF09F3|nr:SPOR domain-containing protein [Sulfurovum sp. bin170]NEW60023.1 SPOR domain-containing protein [Sulfurovum sp. bin170]